MNTISIGCGRLTLDDRGYLIRLQTEEGTSLLPAGMPPQPFLQLGWAGTMHTPLSCRTEGARLIFTFDAAHLITLSVLQKEGYTVFTTEAMTQEGDVLIFGPFFVTPCDAIGDVIGVARDSRWAVGIQALNAKTLAGYPVEYAHTQSPYVASATLSETSVASLAYTDSAAFPAVFEQTPCSLLQLYCENRQRPRVRDILYYSDVSVPPMEHHPDACITGASFALFCCPAREALSVIGQVELGEGLPHPMLHGEWAKTSRESMRSYLIAEFDADTLDSLVAYTKLAGFDTLYHPEPFQTWGHFILRKDCFPEGDASLQAYSQQAGKQGVRLGLHTLSAFTTPSDAYVSPLPDPRLAVLGSSTLSRAVTETETVIPVTDSSVFRTVTTLQTVRIGQELIQYTQAEDGMLTGCKRGLWGTRPAAHDAQETVSLLCDHPYRVYFPNLEMQAELSERLGRLFRETGAAQISFDGLEGCAATGEDNYSLNRFCLDCWEHWNRPDIINDASRLHHNLWHMHTRMNWGEPWGAKMRDGMITQRIKNQDFYRRNLFPRMLGWFLIRKADRKFEATPPEDMEWALSMAAGFDAGFALSTSLTVLQTNGCTEELLSLIRTWEELRLSDRIPESLREQLRSPETEWHLEKEENGSFVLYPLQISQPYVCDLLELQPGQPGGADWVLDNPFADQPYEFRMRVEGYGEIHNPSCYTRAGMLKFPCTIRGSQYLWYRGGKAFLTDRNYRFLEEVPVIGQDIARQGQHPFSFACAFSGEEGPEVTVKVFTRGEGIRIDG